MLDSEDQAQIDERQEAAVVAISDALMRFGSRSLIAASFSKTRKTAFVGNVSS
jgi:hypothetical protein